MHTVPQRKSAQQLLPEIEDSVVSQACPPPREQNVPSSTDSNPPATPGAPITHGGGMKETRFSQHEFDAGSRKTRK